MNKFKVLLDLLPDQAVIAEVGSYRGKSTEEFLVSGKMEVIYCIDEWKENKNKKLLDERLKNFIGCYEPMKEEQIRAATQFRHDLLDGVFINDSNDLKMKIDAWSPIVHQGGYVMGHMAKSKYVQEQISTFNVTVVGDIWWMKV